MSGNVQPRPSAVALSYADRDKAPVVVAKGYGVTAEAIIRTARRSGVYVHGSGELVGLLMQVNLDRQIPPALYLAVAEVMAWVARVDARVARSIEPDQAMRPGRSTH
ncbi:flagellar protein FhlB [Ramlibacter sp. RBP-2]|uniref:Flagellar protein FhlB n=1 Tax=Ramlibacter lithotrophicus TaxID=2606681 RepID=A0A7X6I694_9BURK|nr:flagellar protein FhlB [Ramlibacter lithotrophicus]